MEQGAQRAVVTVVGTGNVGTHVANAIEVAGHTVRQRWNRSLGEPIDTKADIIVVAVKDEAISHVSRLIGQTSALVVHTAGSVSVDTLVQARRGVLYPLQTFSKARAVDFRSVPLFLETNCEEDKPTLEAFARSLSPNTTWLDGERRRRLHLAAVFACNFVNRLYAIADEIISEADIPFSALLPLIKETARKVSELSPREAQTGPAVRWDEEVIAKHLAQLDGTPRAIYELISHSIHDD